jgi:putative ABC transport system permease protein
MHIRPILSAMRRNKVGAFLISLQMALTLAILGNAAFIIEQRLDLMARPSGIDEAGLFTMTNQWIGQPQDLKARVAADLAALRNLPDVADAYVTNSFPLEQSGWSTGLSLSAEQKQSTARAALYFADEHTIDTLRARLIAGRTFSADEIGDIADNDSQTAPVIIVSKALAEAMFPGQPALGKTVYNGHKPATIIGIVDRLQTPWVNADSFGKDFVENSMMAPYHYLSVDYDKYVVRARPGRLDAAMQAVQQKLYQLSRERVLTKVKSYTQVRAEAYRDDRGLAIILAVVCAALVAVTAFGIVGLTSFWVAQRRRQIGVRRALGATKQAILAYFQTENAIITASGAAVGIALAVALNLWMVTSFEMSRIGMLYVLAPALAVVLLGQFAVLWPALRAASIPPALATRAA